MSDWREEARARVARRREEEKAAQDAADARGLEAKGYAWLCASTDPRRDLYANEQAGRKLHAIPADDDETHDAVKRRKSVCGRRAKYGWCSDLFNEKCERCVRKMREMGKEVEP